MGPVYELIVIGVGPGDPELITLKGVRAIQRADLVYLLPAADPRAAVVDPVARRLLEPDWQVVVELDLPAAGDNDPDWHTVAEQILTGFEKRARQEPLRRLLLGVYLLPEEPLLGGSLERLLPLLLEAHPELKLSVLPGVAGFLGTAALSKQVLTHPGDRLAVLPAPREVRAPALRELLLQFETVVLLEAGPVLPELLVILRDLGVLRSAYFAADGTSLLQAVSTAPPAQARQRPVGGMLVVRRQSAR